MEDINKGRCIEAERKNQGKVVRIARSHLRAWREMRSSTGPDNCQRSFTPIEILHRKLYCMTTHLFAIIFILTSVLSRSEILIEKSSLCLASYNIYFHKII